MTLADPKGEMSVLPEICMGGVLQKQYEETKKQNNYLYIFCGSNFRIFSLNGVMLLTLQVLL